MTEPVHVNLVVEDELSEGVLRHLLRESGRPYQVGICYGREGFGYIRRNIAAFNNAAKGTAYILLADLDAVECAPLLVEEWLPVPRHPNLLFRVAVREVEAWLLADRKNLARFLGIQIDLVPQEFDLTPDPKAALIALARKSRRGELWRDLVPMPDSTSRQGPNYNARLADFVENYWDAQVAAQHSLSLAKAMRAIAVFAPTVSPTE
jgi:hypothetical protein